jgi:UDP-N-acetyl-D-mannosaminuronic acid dehydrogenase
MSVSGDSAETTVAIIGLGYVGACVAATLADRGMRVVGVDIDAELVAELNAGHCRFEEDRLAETLRAGRSAGRLRATTDPGAAAAADVVVITVGTPVADDGSLADGQLRRACESLSGHLRPGQLVVVKSTVPPGTTRGLVAPLLEAGGLRAGRDFRLVFTPERLAEGVAMRELRTLPIVVGGLDAEGTAEAADFWRRALEVETITVASAEVAEIVKLADNWWIDLNIAMANELAMYCSLYEVDSLEVIAAANTIPKGGGMVNILLPSVGVGGSCLTKDPLLVRESAARRGLEIRTAAAGREVNSGMPDYTARLVVDGLADLGRDVSEAKVAVLGLAFKNDTGDLRATPTRGVIEALAKAGAEVRLHDPLVDPGEAAEVFGARPEPELADAVRDADCVAVLAYHRCFREVDFGALPVASPCLLVDGRAYLSAEEISELGARGYAYRGIGRPAWPAR